MFDSTCITTHPNQSLIILSLCADDRFHPIDHLSGEGPIEFRDAG